MRNGVRRESQEGENELQERERERDVGGKRATALTQEGGICRDGSTTPTTPTTPVGLNCLTHMGQTRVCSWAGQYCLIQNYTEKCSFNLGVKKI
jgi:hypothetical protein